MTRLLLAVLAALILATGVALWSTPPAPSSAPTATPPVKSWARQVAARPGLNYRSAAPSSRSEPATPQEGVDLGHLPPPPPSKELCPPERPPNGEATSLGVASMLQLQPEDIRQLIDSPDPVTAQAAAWALGNRLKLSDEDAAALLRRLEVTPEDHEDLLATLLWALSLRPDRFPVDAARELALGHPSAAVRRAALRSLGVIDGSQGTLEQCARQDPDAQNRWEAITLLAFVIDSEAAPPLAREAFYAEPDPQVRARWLNLAGLHPSEGSRRLLQDALVSTGQPMEVRRMAALMLAADADRGATQLSYDSSLPAELRSLLSTGAR